MYVTYLVFPKLNPVRPVLAGALEGVPNENDIFLIEIRFHPSQSYSLLLNLATNLVSVTEIATFYL